MDFDGLRTYSFTFVLGMFFSKYNVFELIGSILDSKVKRVIIPLLFFMSMAIVRMFILNDKTTFDGFFAVSIILMSYTIFSNIPILNRAIEYLGKNSAIMFMLHPLVFSLFLYIFQCNISIIIYIILLLLTLIISCFLSWLMKITGYNKLINKLISL